MTTESTKFCRKAIVSLTIVAILAILAMFVLPAVNRQPERSPQELVNPANPSNVVLTIEAWAEVPYRSADGTLSMMLPDSHQTHCSGAVVTRNAFVATAAHCMDRESLAEDIAQRWDNPDDPYGTLDPDQVKITAIDILVVQTSGINGKVFDPPLPASIVSEGQYDLGTDVALLRVPGLAAATVPYPLARHSLQMNDTLYKVGYASTTLEDDLVRYEPSFSSTAAADRIARSTATPLVIEGKVIDMVYGPNHAYIGSDAVGSGGMSGGAILNRDGELVGINSQTIPGDRGNLGSAFVSLDNLRLQLDAARVPYEQNPEPLIEDLKAVIDVLTGIAIGTIIAILAVGASMLGNRPAKQEPPMDTTPFESAAALPQTPDQPVEPSKDSEPAYNTDQARFAYDPSRPANEQHLQPTNTVNGYSHFKK